MIEPTFGNIVIEEDKDTQLAGGIMLPGTEKDSTVGVVAAICEKVKDIKMLASNIKLTLNDIYTLDTDDSVKVGDKIVYKRYAYTDCEFEGKKYRIVQLSD